jgi:MraZ protein
MSGTRWREFPHRYKWWNEIPVQHAILYGEHELTLDEKNRLLVPAEVRKSLEPERDGRAFFLVVGQNQRLWFYPENYYSQIVTQSQQDLTLDEDHLAFDQIHFARANRVEWDSQGRLVIPTKALRRAGIGETDREVTLIGVRDHLELWTRADWDAREAELSRRHAEILKARQARKGDAPKKE